MRRRPLNPFHHRLLSALPVGEPVAFRALVAASGLRLAEVPIPLAELVNEGYITTEQRPDERGGMERLYTRLERPVQESTIVREE